MGKLSDVINELEEIKDEIKEEVEVQIAERNTDFNPKLISGLKKLAMTGNGDEPITREDLYHIILEVEK